MAMNDDCRQDSGILCLLIGQVKMVREELEDDNLWWMWKAGKVY